MLGGLRGVGGYATVVFLFLFTAFFFILMFFIAGVAGYGYYRFGRVLCRGLAQGGV